MSLSSPSTENRSNVFVLGAVAFCAALIIFLPRWMATDISRSPVSGLISQKALVQQSIPYDVALANGKPTLLEFYADWCTVCQSLAPTLEQVHTQLGERVNFVMLDIDNPQWKAQVQQFQATGVPHLTLLDADHRPVETWIGKVPQSILSDRVESLLNSFGSF